MKDTTKINDLLIDDLLFVSLPFLHCHFELNITK